MLLPHLMCKRTIYPIVVIAYHWLFKHHKEYIVILAYKGNNGIQGNKKDALFKTG